ncbi:hypothetical protein ACPEGK_28610 [Klebsiella sp. K794]|uniref:hypothetical protein n=1 Tax=Klebsiella TaxID=570 RepID=UPI0009B5DA1F|nr:hypothetical protein [Klebsiella michiganensis]ARB21559.1 hypothetical protein AM394_10190 [Klebsiella oxytoca]MDM4120881.1 hypothetical protein [Klebsiella michiganensis]MDM4157731.1 hypothetical protein [Klebsiella michiganensis]NHE79987.1 hypothetical protein [Klebsiella michiganensis]QET47875.1 hypothetical protein FOB55_07425 [Klebsiella michiganensis]
MNISTVNELIQSLESAGELSIKETKVMELAREFKRLAAENVALAAENKMAVDAVTVFSNVTHDITDIICDELGHDRVAEIVAAYNDLGNMPATDRILAEAEARGVEKAIAHLEKKFSNIGVQIMNLQWLADSLREGADK